MQTYYCVRVVYTVVLQHWEAYYYYTHIYNLWFCVVLLLELSKKKGFSYLSSLQKKKTKKKLTKKKLS